MFIGIYVCTDRRSDRCAADPGKARCFTPDAFVCASMEVHQKRTIYLVKTSHAITNVIVTTLYDTGTANGLGCKDLLSRAANNAYHHFFSDTLFTMEAALNRHNYRIVFKESEF